MFLDLPDPHPDPLVTSTDSMRIRLQNRLRIHPFSDKSVEQTEIMVAK
jgi:hypothetical protein